MYSVGGACILLGMVFGFLLLRLFLGDNVICGSYDSKLVWFDLDFFIRLYRVLR